MKTIVIANPAAGNGKAGERWPRIRKAVYKLMPSHTAVMTEEPGHATELARQAVRDGFQRILVYGGDGTVNEVVNGMFLGGKNLKKDIVLGIIPVAPSVGGDFCRSLGLNGKASQALDVILDNRTETIDIGRVSYADEQGHADERHFVNMAGMGLSNDVVSKVNKARRSKSLSASVAFKFSALTGKLNHVSNMMRIEIDGYRPVYETACSIHICNGRFAAWRDDVLAGSGVERRQARFGDDAGLQGVSPDGGIESALYRRTCQESGGQALPGQRAENQLRRPCLSGSGRGAHRNAACPVPSAGAVAECSVSAALRA